jgi:SurA-like N-terminal domain
VGGAAIIAIQFFPEHRAKLLSAVTAGLLGLAACLAFAPRTPAETLDRVVASVDSQAITERDVETEYRFEQFLDGKMPATAPDTATLAGVRDRLVDQTLLAEEAQRTALKSDAAAPQATRELEEIRKAFPSPQAYSAALQAVGLDREEILQRLRRRDGILKMVDQRLRPEAWVEAAQIQDYYTKTFLPAYEKQHPGPPPPFEKVEGQIREILTEKKITQLLEGWLTELKSSHVVRVHSF